MYRIALLPLLALSATALASPADEFWNELGKLCGKAYAGELKQEPAGEDSFAGKRLMMHVRECSAERIRIPFMVGEDRSRTWVLSRRDGRIELKHDHRHADGTPEEVTMYGGTATNAGRADAQYFPADEETRRVIERAFSNVWSLTLVPGESFGYGVQRLGTERVFRIEFDLRRELEAPPAPWGWQDDSPHTPTRATGHESPP